MATVSPSVSPSVSIQELAVLGAKAERARALSRQIEALQGEVDAIKAELKNSLGIGKHDLGLVRVTVSEGSRESFELTDGEKEVIRRHGRNKVSSYTAVRIS